MRCIAGVTADIVSAKKLFKEMKILTEADGKIVRGTVRKCKQTEYVMAGFGTNVSIVKKNNIEANQWILKMHGTKILESIFGMDFWIYPHINNSSYSGQISRNERFIHIRGIGDADIMFSYDLASLAIRVTAKVTISSKEEIQELRYNENYNKGKIMEIKKKIEGQFFFDVETNVWQYACLVEQASGNLVEKNNTNKVIVDPVCYVIEAASLDMTVNNDDYMENFLHIVENKDEVNNVEQYIILFD